MRDSENSQPRGAMREGNRARARRAAIAAVLIAVAIAWCFYGAGCERRTHDKTGWRHFTRIWQQQGPPARVVFFPSRMERAAEYNLRCPVFSAPRDLMESELPALQGSEIWVCTLDGWVLSDDEFNYYQRLMTLGDVHHIPIPTGLFLQAVRVDSTNAGRRQLGRWFTPRDIPGRIEGFHSACGFHILEHETPTSTTFRWSAGKAFFRVVGDDRWSTVVLNVQFPPPAFPDYQPKLKIYAKRGKRGDSLFRRAPIVAIRDFRPGPMEVELPAADLGRGPLWIGWIVNCVNLADCGVSRDNRDLGLRLNWVGLKR